ncbi:ATPase [Rickettsiales endosymbiont of Peranema trichophorum]|uniref:division plane positioning ATPase MipZ n=1 Tax=Rickettsiales endosymbiont of Peranema trichophorum TaxID=2486577 RepID=UPI0010237554|nr:division plane positioning ATPase MipZ [Rickettsiales endosymbiont of Peranema trichophorum]RZI47655.1 ATPase [Rickettsiales endosymbiont of Peranema trichophorum]
MAARVIVLGNEKGGSGKTTTAMHLIVSLLNLQFKVGSIDIDTRQCSLTRYMENRTITKDKLGIPLLLPTHSVIPNNKGAGVKEEEAFLTVFNAMKESNDFIVIDTPGNDSPLSRIAHFWANTVITPLNDSFVDVDLIGKISADSLDVITPGVYSAMLWEQKVKRAAQDGTEIRWIIMTNRLSQLESINKRNVDSALNKLSKKFGFVISPGFSDRVIFKELFLHGLTLHDVNICQIVRMTSSMVAARQELRQLMQTLKLEI